jgi:hypothetical protein
MRDHEYPMESLVAVFLASHLGFSLPNGLYISSEVSPSIHLADNGCDFPTYSNNIPQKQTRTMSMREKTKVNLRYGTCLNFHSRQDPYGVHVQEAVENDRDACDMLTPEDYL